MAPAAVPFVFMGASALYAGYSAKQTADFNAKMANQEATYQDQKGAAEEKQQMERMRKLMGSTRVAGAKSGVSLMSGSFQDVFRENAQDMIYDALTIRHNADIAAESSRARASAFKSEGRAAVGKSLLDAAAVGSMAYNKFSVPGSKTRAINTPWGGK